MPYADSRLTVEGRGDGQQLCGESIGKDSAPDESGKLAEINAVDLLCGDDVLLVKACIVVSSSDLHTPLPQ